MSKLIVEMEMPKHGCCDCMVEFMGLCVIQDKDVPLKNENGDYPTELPKGCPIKGVLPDEHGRLIDEAVFCENVVKYSHQSTKTIGKALNATPTIIEMTPNDGQEEVNQ